MITNKQRIEILKQLKSSEFKGNYIQMFKKIEEGGLQPKYPFISVMDNTFVNIPKKDINIPLMEEAKTGPLVIPDNKEDIKQNPEFINRQLELQSKADISSKPKLKIFDFTNISGIQTFLKNKGYDIGKYGVDNKLGIDTISAMQKYLKNNGYYIGQDKFANKGVDGKLGKITLKAIEEFNQDNITGRKSIYHSKYSDEEGFLGNCDEKQCAEFSQKELKKNTTLTESDLVNKVGFTGNAWNIENNLISKGGTHIYSKDKKINRLDSIKPGDHISFYTGGLSEYQSQAGKNKPTHSALVDSTIQYYDRRPFVYVVHNIHKKTNKGYQGRMFRSKMYLDNLSLDGFPQYKPTSIVAPNLSGSKEKTAVVPDLDLNIDTSDINNPYRLKAVEGLNDKKFRQRSMTDFNLNDEEYMSLAIATLGLMDQESGFGEKGKIPIINNKLELVGKEITATTIRGLSGKEGSLGWARIKYNTNFKDVKNRLETDYGLTKSKLSVISDKGNNSAKAALIIVAKYYNQLKQKSDINNEGEALYLALQKFNKYNLETTYGNEKKTAYEYAKEGNLNYVNKILDYSRKYYIKDNKGTKYKTLVDYLNVDINVATNQLLN